MVFLEDFIIVIIASGSSKEVYQRRLIPIVIRLYVHLESTFVRELWHGPPFTNLGIQNLSKRCS